MCELRLPEPVKKKLARSFKSRMFCTPCAAWIASEQPTSRCAVVSAKYLPDQNNRAADVSLDRNSQLSRLSFLLQREIVRPILH